MRIFGIAAMAAVLLASPALAQQGSDGLTGTRVRVTAPNFFPAPVRGTVTSYTQQGLTVAREDTTADSAAVTITVPLRAVSRLDRFAGGSASSTAWYRGRLGAFVGAGLGLIAGPLSAKVTGKGVGESAILGGALGLTSGFVVGAVIGAAAPRERWTWAMQPWGYDASLRPDPIAPPPPPPAVAQPVAAPPAASETATPAIETTTPPAATTPPAS
jgi:hypothetical protein